MIVLGLTGSIGMGKSSTARMFADRGIPVHDADAVVHRLYEGKATQLIEQAFSGTTNGKTVDRKKLADRVVGKPKEMKKLEAIIHPLVAAEREAFLAAERKRASPLVLLDIPLLFETGSDSFCDMVLVVTAPMEVQKQRVLSRAGMNEEKLQNILSRQLPDEEKRRRADFIIDTSLGMENAEKQVDDIIRQILNGGADNA